MKKLSRLVLITMMLFTCMMSANLRLTYANVANEVHEVVTFEGTDFTLKLPGSWEGKYKVGANEALSTGNRTAFINKATKGVLFAVSTVFKDHWSAIRQDTIGIIGSHLTEAGEKGDRIYLIITPTDVQYDPSDETSMVDFLSMAADVKTIINTFEIKDDLASSSNTIESISENVPKITIANDLKEIPALEGTYCWGACVDKEAASAMIKNEQYQPLSINASSTLYLQFADNLQPAVLKASKIFGPSPERIEDVDLINNQIIAPTEPGEYMYDIEAIWTYPDGTTAGSAQYFFKVVVG